MHEIQQRLIHCFATVFPNLDDIDIRRASYASVANWDSLAIVKLVSVVEEEFNVSIPSEDFESMTSFDLVLDCVQRRIGEMAPS
jgi:acyl carrier protein